MRIRRSPVRFFLPALLLLLGLGMASPGAMAEEEIALPEPLLDYFGLLARTQDELSHFAEKARWPGHDGALAYIWKVHVQKRGNRARRYVKELQKTNRWHLDPETAKAVMLKDGSWTAFIQRLAKAYSELAAARDGLRKIKVSPHRAIHVWVKRHPEPNLNVRTADERALDAHQGSMRLLIANGKRVPAWMYTRERELIDAARESRILLEAAHAQWIVDKAAAIKAIEAAVQETKNAAQLEGKRLELHLKNFQELTAAMQAQEETRIRNVLATLPEDARLAAAAKKDLALMVKGRAAGVAYDTAKSSKWSSLVRQGWMRPRNHLLSAMSSARSRAARAAAAAKAAEEAKKAASKEAGKDGPEKKDPEEKDPEKKDPEKKESEKDGAGKGAAK